MASVADFLCDFQAARIGYASLLLSPHALLYLQASLIQLQLGHIPYAAHS